MGAPMQYHRQKGLVLLSGVLSSDRRNVFLSTSNNDEYCRILYQIQVYMFQKGSLKIGEGVEKSKKTVMEECRFL